MIAKLAVLDQYKLAVCCGTTVRFSLNICFIRSSVIIIVQSWKNIPFSSTSKRFNSPESLPTKSFVAMVQTNKGSVSAF